MLFKNAAMYRFTKPFGTIDAPFPRHAVEHSLEQAEFPGIGPHDTCRLGWAPALPGGQEFVHSVNGCHLVRLRKDEKIMPAAGINREVSERAAVIEAEQGRKITRKERNDIRDQVILERLPTAFVQTKYTVGYIDEVKSLLIIDAGTGRQAEDFCSALRQAIGSLPVRPVCVNQSPSFVFTDALVNISESEQTLLQHFTIGEECTLTDSDGGKASFKDMDLEEAADKHLQDGMSCTSLRISLADRVAFTVTDELRLKKIKFLDDFMEALTDVDSDDGMALADTMVYLMTTEVRAVFEKLMESFGGEDKDAVVE
jgi:recombination associated protein RdgC